MGCVVDDLARIVIRIFLVQKIGCLCKTTPGSQKRIRVGNNYIYFIFFMKKFSLGLVAGLMGITFLFSSCMATMHTVGKGGKGDCKSVGQYDAEKKQWYWLFGALPLNKVDSKELAGGAQNYTIRTTNSLIDYLIDIPGTYLLGIRSQTIRVSKGDK